MTECQRHCISSFLSWTKSAKITGQVREKLLADFRSSTKRAHAGGVSDDAHDGVLLHSEEENCLWFWSPLRRL